MTQIKICGLTRPEDILCVNRERPDYAGFIVNFPKSRRNLEPEKLAALTSQLDPSVVPVGVFVDRPAEEIASLLKAGTIRIAQLHGHEDKKYIRTLRRLTGAPLWQAFQIRSREDLDRAMAAISDGAIVGSAIVKLLARYGQDAPGPVSDFVRSMKEALR